MDLKFYSELSDGCPSNSDPEFMESPAYGGYPEESKQFSEGSDSFLTISGGGDHFLSAEQTFHTPSLGDEVFEIPPIALDPDQALSISEAVSHYDLTDGSDDTSGSSGSRSLVSNLVAEANDPSFASTFVNSGSHGLEQLNLGTMGQAGGALLSSSALEMGNSGGSHFSRSPPMTIDVQLSDLGHGLLEGSQLSSINPSELTLGLCGSNAGRHPDAPDQPLLISSSPVGSLQDEDMDDFQRSVLVDSPMSLSSATPVLSHPAPPSSASTAAARRGGGKPAALALAAEPAGGKKGRRKKDPNEPQKPVSAYALFFRDTQSAIKGQNPNASFGDVSKIVASMWDSLAEDQKQVYKKKTEAAKKEYLTALAAYKASQLSQLSSVEMETSSSGVNLTPAAPLSTGQKAVLLPSANASVEANTKICTSNIILDIPEVTTPSHLGANPAGTPTAVLPPGQTITKIIIPKHLLQGGSQVVTLLSGGVGAAQPTLLVSSTARQPPPLQQMQNAPPPPRLQQMAPAPPPLQAKPREGMTALSQPVSFAATSPPPLQIKIVPASVQDRLAATVVVPSSAAAASSVQVVQEGSCAAVSGDDDVAEVLDSDEDVMEVSAPGGGASVKSMCVRAGCTNPAVDSEDWDREFCSNECVATHCSDVFKAWCSIRNQNLGTVK